MPFLSAVNFQIVSRLVIRLYLQRVSVKAGDVCSITKMASGERVLF